MKSNIAVVALLSVALAGCSVSMASQSHTMPSGQVFETLSVVTESGQQIITCPLTNGRLVVSKCFASSGNSVTNNVLTALMGTVLPATGVFFAKGHTFNVGASSYAGAEANVDLKIKK